MFTKYVLKFFAIIFDYLIYLLSISIFKPIAYQYKEVSLSYRIGKVIDDIKYPNDNEHYYAKKLDAYASTLKDSLSFRISTFSYALGMICIGLIVIFIFVFLFK
jgi:hypothetical protein